ncbi:hypothetical protein MNEG_13698 [Monoraphidium neglectum]|uniref:EDR1/CTR1/ARMC3-like peptidase-like domain-containing protein n=1 Tax=Monoraphidium neglectum TaxID=145388 RepID=A0A0D2MGU9_9CHLO|nr:hypothetical protein MNEG_13698 [Monoraphidium neglectum]KIY94265.1 hypothetical protein MNEG_13698 [Monoraphidium neglectum]|eukprot:XP_013893285.1 hypothetical protein MNEG_13698 [Monoraphidium neglectum]
MALKWLKRRKEQRAQGDAPQAGSSEAPAPPAAAAAPPPPPPPPPPAALPHRTDSGSDYTDDDDEPVHDFEIAQEDYLVSVALATSANEYQRNGGGGGGFPSAMGAAAALELSEKYWVTCRLSYGELLCDGFYDVWGDYPEIVERGEFPTLAALRHVQLFEGDPREVRRAAAAPNCGPGARRGAGLGPPISAAASAAVAQTRARTPPAAPTLATLGCVVRRAFAGYNQVMLVNRLLDEGLNRIESLAEDALAQVAPYGDADRVQALATLVAEHLGGPYAHPERLRRAHLDASAAVKASSRSVILLIGQLRVGAARHRALLFKVLADALGLECQLLRGAGYTGSDDGADVVVRLEGRDWRARAAMATAAAAAAAAARRRGGKG